MKGYLLTTLLFVGALGAGTALGQDRSFGFSGTYASIETAQCASSMAGFAPSPGLEALGPSTNILNTIEATWRIRTDGTITKRQTGVFLVGAVTDTGFPPGGTWMGDCTFSVVSGSPRRIEIEGSCTDQLLSGYDYGTTSVATQLRAQLTRGLVPEILLISDIARSRHVLTNATTGNTFTQICGSSGTATKIR